MSVKLTEKQLYMLKDVASYNFKKYRYQAMPSVEIEARDSRVIDALLRKGLIEYPVVYDKKGLPDMAIDGIRITEQGIAVLKEYKGK